MYKVALIGYGKMNRMVEAILLQKGHKIVSIITSNNAEAILQLNNNSCNFAIEFTSPHVAIDNIEKLVKHNIPIICGSTGWADTENGKKLMQKLQENNYPFVYGANFSISAQIFFAINDKLAYFFSHFPNYDYFIEERHHKQKKDAPSGTAIKLAQQIIDANNNKNNIATAQNYTNEAIQSNMLSIGSIRSGDIVGKHTIGYVSENDLIEITHSAHNRSIFAEGAVIAAEWLMQTPGFYSFEKLFKQKMQL